MKAIMAKYLGPTNTRGARIVATDEDGNRATVPYEYAITRDSRYDGAAMALCRKMGWSGTLVRGWLKNGAVYVFYDKQECVEIDDSLSVTKPRMK